MITIYAVIAGVCLGLLIEQPVRGAEQLTVDVDLALIPRGVADSDRAGVPPATQGKHSQSTEPVRLTNAALCRSESAGRRCSGGAAWPALATGRSNPRTCSEGVVADDEDAPQSEIVADGVTQSRALQAIIEAGARQQARAACMPCARSLP